MKNFKNDLRGYLFSQDWKIIDYNTESVSIEYIFNDLPKSMQWGVYVDFFDSVGIDIQAYCYHSKYSMHIYNKEDTMLFDQNNFDTREEAREKAIEKAIEIYNNQ